MKRKTPLKRTPIKTKKNYYKSKADRLWQELMHVLWGYRCAKCGKLLGENEGAGHHLIKKRVLHLAHHPKCGMLLCDRCHNHAPDAPHNHSPELFEKFVEEEYPEIYTWVQEHKNEYGTKPDYKEVCKDLEKLLREAKAKRGGR